MGLCSFPTKRQQHDHNLNNDTFARLPIISAQCIIGTETYAVVGISSNYDDGDYFQGYGQIKEAFKALTKDNIHQPYLNEDDFKSSSVGDDGNEIGFFIHSFDI